MYIRREHPDRLNTFRGLIKKYFMKFGSSDLSIKVTSIIHSAQTPNGGVILLPHIGSFVSQKVLKPSYKTLVRHLRSWESVQPSQVHKYECLLYYIEIDLYCHPGWQCLSIHIFPTRERIFSAPSLLFSFTIPFFQKFVFPIIRFQLVSAYWTGIVCLLE